MSPFEILRRLANWPLALLLSLCAGVANAQGILPQQAPPTAPRTEPSEALIQRSVIEDEGSRVEELKVRGQVRQIIVTTKGAIPSRYEILPPDGSGSEIFKASAGKRVWSLLQF